MEFFLIILVVAYISGWYAYKTTNFKKESGRKACFACLMAPLFLGSAYLFFLESGNFWYFGAILLMAMVALLSKGVIRYILQTLYFLGMIGLGVWGFFEGTNTDVVYGLVRRIEYGWFYFHMYAIKSEIVWKGTVGTIVGESTSFYWTNALIVLAVYIVFFAFPLYIWCSNIATTVRARRNKHADKVYAKFASVGITDLNDADRKRDVLLIKKHYGLKTAKLRKLFVLGKERAQNIEQEEQKKEKVKTRKKVTEEQKSYEEEQARSNIRGKEKYLQPVRKAYSAADAYHAQLMDMCGEDFFEKKKADNWGWAGGLAAGIAGPVAGAIAAVEAHERNMAHNAAAEAHNRALVEAGYTSFEIDEMLDNERESVALSKSILSDAWNDIEDRVLDDADVEDKMRYLQFDVSGRVDAQKKLKMQVDVQLVEQPLLLGKPAILDGSVRIDVLNERGKKVGEAYYNAPGFDTGEMDTVGFAEKATCKAVVKSTTGKGFSEDEAYTYKVTPIALWLIEE